MNREAVKNLLVAWGSPTSDLMIEAMSENLTKNGFAHYGLESSGNKIPAPILFPFVTRVTLVGPNGVEFEKYQMFADGQGALLQQQDNGRTLKIFPGN